MTLKQKKGSDVTLEGYLSPDISGRRQIVSVVTISDYRSPSTLYNKDSKEVKITGPIQIIK